MDIKASSPDTTVTGMSEFKLKEWEKQEAFKIADKLTGPGVEDVWDTIDKPSKT